MECRPFRFKQRRTRISGRKPEICTLYDGELYLNTCDGTAFFKNSACDGLHSFITDASGNGLEKLKFSGAVCGDIPMWDGYKIVPTAFNGSIETGQFITCNQTGQFITCNQTGQFLTSGQTGQFITTGQTGQFVKTGQTGQFVTTGQTGNFLTTSQTGQFANVNQSVILTGDQLVSGIKSFSNCIVLTGDFPRIIDFGNCFTIENGMGASLNSPYGFSINAIDAADTCNSPLYKNFQFYNDQICGSVFRLPQDVPARAYIVINIIPTDGASFSLTDSDGISHSFDLHYDSQAPGGADYHAAIDEHGTVEEAANSIAQAIIDSTKFQTAYYDAVNNKIWIYQKSIGIAGNRGVTNQGMEGVSSFDGGTTRLIFGDGSVQTTAFNDTNFVKITGNQIVSGIKNFDQRPTVNGTGVLLSGENPITDTGFFSQKGDSEYLNYFGRLITNSTTTSGYLSGDVNNSMYLFKNNDNIYFTADISAVGTDAGAAFKIDAAAIKKSSNSTVQILNSTKSTIYKTCRDYDANIFGDISDGSLKISVCGDNSNQLKWYGKISMLRIDNI